MEKSRTTSQIDDLDILSSTWILASNDENPIMTYKSLQHRLGIGNRNVKNLILKRGDLFRQKVPQHILDNWKEQMISGKKSKPSWIAELPENQQKDAIDRITRDDVFRSQFRAEPNAPKSDINVIAWGLEHIDRLRQLRSGKRENWFKLISVLVIPAITLGLTYYTVVSNNTSQAKMKEYEVTFKIKQENYARFMEGAYNTFESAHRNGVDTLNQNIKDLEATYFNIEPFLNKADREYVWYQYQSFLSVCLDYKKQLQITDHKTRYLVDSKYVDSLVIYKERFHKVLYPALFPNQ